MVEIIKIDCPKNKYSVKCPFEMTPTRVVIHNTANDTSARNEVSYMHRNGNTVSFHFAVDDKEIVQGIDLDRNAYHSGDGRNGKGNREGIAIEICYSYSKKKVNGKWVADEEKWKSQYKEKFEKAQKNAAELTAHLLKKYGWGIDKVTKHQDYSGKYCPHRTLADYGWDYFLNLVKSFMSECETVNKETKPTTENKLTAGKKVTLSNVPLYTSSTTEKASGKKTGTFYLWSDEVINNRIRITNDVSRVGVSGQVTGWIDVSAIGVNTAETKPTTATKPTTESKPTYKAGQAINLSNAPLYATSTTTKVSAKKTGKYYLWNDKVLNNRIRITNKTANVGVSGQVTGWIDVSSIK